MICEFVFLLIRLGLMRAWKSRRALRKVCLWQYGASWKINCWRTLTVISRCDISLQRLNTINHHLDYLIYNGSNFLPLHEIHWHSFLAKCEIETKINPISQQREILEFQSRTKMSKNYWARHFIYSCLGHSIQVSNYYLFYQVEFEIKY